MTRQDLIEKVTSACITAVFLFLCTEAQLLAAAIVVGIGHIAATLFYQRLGNRITRRFLISFIAVAGLLFASYLLYPYPRLLRTFTIIYFVVHLLFDEMHLTRTTPRLLGGLELLPLFVLSSAFILDRNYYVGALSLGIQISLVLLVLFLVAKAVSRSAFTKVNLYFLCLYALPFSLFALDVPITIYQFFSALALYHYSNWYIHYYLKRKAEPKALKDYLFHMGRINAWTVLLFLFYHLKIPYLAFCLGAFFRLESFFIWTILHLLFTTREKDFAFWLPKRGPHAEPV